MTNSQLPKMGHKYCEEVSLNWKTRLRKKYIWVSDINVHQCGQNIIVI